MYSGLVFRMYMFQVGGGGNRRVSLGLTSLCGLSTEGEFGECGSRSMTEKL